MPGSEAWRIHMQEVIPALKSKPYSGVSVKSVEVAMLARSHPGQACVVGVDVGKVESSGT